MENFSSSREKKRLTSREWLVLSLFITLLISIFIISITSDVESEEEIEQFFHL